MHLNADCCEPLWSLRLRLAHIFPYYLYTQVCVLVPLFTMTYTKYTRYALKKHDTHGFPAEDRGAAGAGRNEMERDESKE